MNDNVFCLEQKRRQAEDGKHVFTSEVYQTKEGFWSKTKLVDPSFDMGGIGMAFRDVAWADGFELGDIDPLETPLAEVLMLCGGRLIVNWNTEAILSLEDLILVRCQLMRSLEMIEKALMGVPDDGE